MATKDEFKLVNIADISERIQMRADGLDQDYVAELAEKLDQLPPAPLFWDGKTYRLPDANHTIAAHELKGRTQAKCKIMPGGLKEAKSYARKANSEHGKRRTNADKRKAVNDCFADPDCANWTDGKIAEECAVSEFLVRSVRAEVSPPIKSEVTERLGKDGKKYNVANIGKTKANKPTEPSAETPDEDEDVFFPKSKPDPAKPNEDHADPDKTGRGDAWEEEAAKKNEPIVVIGETVDQPTDQVGEDEDDEGETSESPFGKDNRRTPIKKQKTADAFKTSKRMWELALAFENAGKGLHEIWRTSGMVHCIQTLSELTDRAKCDDITMHLRQFAPYAVCPKCSEELKLPDGKPCDLCVTKIRPNGKSSGPITKVTLIDGPPQGWITKTVHQQLHSTNPDLLKIADRNWKPAKPTAEPVNVLLAQQRVLEENHRKKSA